MFFVITFLACKEKTLQKFNKPFDEWKEHDKGIPGILASQLKDTASEYYGSIPDAFGIHHPISCAGFIQNLSVAFILTKSAYYHSESLIDSMEIALNYLLKMQHSDGTIDLLSTNFHSTPDLGFSVEPMAIAYKLLERDNSLKTLKLRAGIKEFLIKGGEALAVGGIHTPNHRWVVCMALARIHELFPNEKYIARINEWLAEGIDIDPEGQYNEKSTAVYTPLTNRTLITIARLMNKPELYEHVKKNLVLTKYLIHSNGELVTETSRRQDQYLARTSDIYLYPYVFMIAKFDNDEFKQIVNTMYGWYGDKLKTNLMAPLLEDNSLSFSFSPKKYELKYDTLFPLQGMARWSDGSQDASIIHQNSTLFTLHRKDAVLQSVRYASAFFGKGQFKSDSIFKIDGGYKLVQYLEGPYYQPFPIDSIKKYGSDWDKMPRNNRIKSEVQKIKYQLIAKQLNGTWNLHFSINGTDRVPCAIELVFRNGGVLSGVEKSSKSNDVYFLSGKEGKYESKEASITFGPGMKSHEWTEIRGAEPKTPGQSVHLTTYTPLNFTLKIKATDN